MDWGKKQDFGDNGVETPLKKVLPTHPSTWILSQHGHVNSFILALMLFSFFIPSPNIGVKIKTLN